LQQVLALLDPAAAVLARRVRAALDRALLGQAALALQEELHALPPADAALRSKVPRHATRPGIREMPYGVRQLPRSNSSPLPRPHAVVRLRGHVLHSHDLEAGRLQRAD